MKIPLRRLPRSEYPVEPGMYLWDQGDDMDSEIESVMIGLGTNGRLWCQSGTWSVQQKDICDGIAWSERIECEVVG